VDSEIRRIVEEAYARAKAILIEKAADLEKLAQAMLEYETLSGDEITDVLNDVPLNRDGVKSRSPKKGKTKAKSSVPTLGAGGLEPVGA
jgi:cell division protease FtsH